MAHTSKRFRFVFPAMLDTVLRQSPLPFEPVLRFYSLLVPHFIIRDTQLIDNALFREDPLFAHKEGIFRSPGADGLPLFIIVKRESCSLVEITIEKMLRVGDLSREPTYFSSLTGAQRATLNELRNNGALNRKKLETAVGYPVSGFLDPLDTALRDTTYSNLQEYVWKTSHLREVVFGVLGLPQLVPQFALRNAHAKALLKEISSNDVDSRLSLAYKSTLTDFTRTTAYKRLRQLRSSRAKKRHGLQKIPRDDFNRVIQGVRACVDYAYLREFADANKVSFMLDDSHWFPSRTVNMGLGADRPAAEAAEQTIEQLLDINETSCDGHSSERHRQLLRWLEKCGFAQHATWDKILLERSSNAFLQRLQSVNQAASQGENSEAAELFADHVRTTFSKLVPSQSIDWKQLVIGVAFGALGVIAPPAGIAALGFATAGGGAALALHGTHVVERRRQRSFIDAIASSVTSRLRGSPSGR
jgi:hypothetical protein